MSHKQQIRYVERKETRARNEVVYFVGNKTSRAISRMSARVRTIKQNGDINNSALNPREIE